MEHVYLGRQPILDDKGTLVAFEILYRDNNQESSISDDRYASASVISSVLNKFGTQSLLGSRRAFVKVDERFLLHDIILSIPKEFFIFSLFSDIELSEHVLQRIELLHKEGYQIAINDFHLDAKSMQKYSPILDALSYVKINLDQGIDLNTRGIVSELKTHAIKVVGSKIEDTKQYKLARRFGCEMFQGYFFAKPNIMENAKYEPARINILNLYNLLINDTNIDEITSEFEKNYEITVQLLQYINSAAFHFRSRISSIHHILTLVGRRPLAQWLMLMIYSKSVSKENKTSPIMLLIQSRTQLMQNILKITIPSIKSNMLGEAYFVGVLSLIDSIFGRELSEILEEMHVSDEVKDALLYDKGILGEIYFLVRSLEVFNTKTIEEFENKHRLKHNSIRDLVLQDMEDVNNFEEAMSS
jgi:EAL and modified HD-GYP domain-containing signal transduction protein